MTSDVITRILRLDRTIMKREDFDESSFHVKQQFIPLDAHRWCSTDEDNTQELTTGDVRRLVTAAFQRSGKKFNSFDVTLAVDMLFDPGHLDCWIKKCNCTEKGGAL